MSAKWFAIAILTGILGIGPASHAGAGTAEQVEANTKIAKSLLASGRDKSGDYKGTHAYTGYYGGSGNRHNSLWVYRKEGTSTVRSRFALHPEGDPKNPDGVARHVETTVYEDVAAAPTAPKPITHVKTIVLGPAPDADIALATKQQGGSVSDAIRLAKGNFGAVKVISELGPEGVRLLDQQGIRGSDIWLLYKDENRESGSATLAALKDGSAIAKLKANRYSSFYGK